MRDSVKALWQGYLISTWRMKEEQKLSNLSGRFDKVNRKSLILKYKKYDVVVPAGFEPATVRLEGGCSIQLSYGTESSIFLYFG